MEAVHEAMCTTLTNTATYGVRHNLGSAQFVFSMMLVESIDGNDTMKQVQFKKVQHSAAFHT